MELFDTCQAINELIINGDEISARNELIKFLAKIESTGIGYSPLVNHLIRDVGLYPYMTPSSSAWQDRYVYEVFKADIGESQPVTLHREQSRLLNALLSGKSIAVSAPTSFGKSFVIDSFISISKPDNVVIIVPTIALADETRRRLQKKFGDEYKIIITPDQPLADKNILIFPQERSIGYVNKLESIDILIVDEFYKASKKFDKERSPALIYAIIKLGEIARQKYFLAPNITTLEENPFTRDMDFFRLDFNTVFLEKNELYNDIGRDEQKKSNVLLNILENYEGKTLIYAGTHPSIKKISNLLLDTQKPKENKLLKDFQHWLTKNYDPNWELTKLIPKAIGIHNGQLHRSLSQIQIKLFDEANGLNCLISTSSIIEGVNTSAQNVVLWSNKNGKVKINDFTYKNIIGRSGRMFKHFIGRVFILEEPPKEEETQLELELPDELLGTINKTNLDIMYTPEQVARIQGYEYEMSSYMGHESFNFLHNSELLQSSNSNLILAIAKDIYSKPQEWNGLKFLNSDNVASWDRLLYKIINLQPSGWEIEWGKYINFVKILSKNWIKTIPELLDDLNRFDIGIDDFFKLEKNTTFKLSALLSDVNTIYNKVHKDNQIDLSLAIGKMSHAFLPSVVYQLEEYGMPRMISKKIHRSGIINMEDSENNIHDIILVFEKIGIKELIYKVNTFEDFEIFVLNHFYDGILVNKK